MSEKTNTIPAPKKQEPQTESRPTDHVAQKASYPWPSHLGMSVGFYRDLSREQFELGFVMAISDSGLVDLVLVDPNGGTMTPMRFVRHVDDPFWLSEAGVRQAMRGNSGGWNYLDDMSSFSIPEATKAGLKMNQSA